MPEAFTQECRSCRVGIGSRLWGCLTLTSPHSFSFQVWPVCVLFTGSPECEREPIPKPCFPHQCSSSQANEAKVVGLHLRPGTTHFLCLAEEQKSRELSWREGGGNGLGEEQAWGTRPTLWGRELWVIGRGLSALFPFLGTQKGGPRRNSSSFTDFIHSTTHSFVKSMNQAHYRY